jgi:Fe-S oxidoreductase
LPDHPNYDILGIPSGGVLGVLLLATLVCFAVILRRRLKLLKLAAAEPRVGFWGTRIKNLLTIGFGQSRQPRYKVAGIVHIVLFGGFLILSLRSVSLMAEAIWPGAADLGFAYEAVKDWTGLLVLFACAIAAWRRVIVQPKRYSDRHAHQSHGREALVILGLISLLMIADAFLDGSRQAHGWATPLASLTNAILPESESLRQTIALTSFWIHNAALFFFLCLLPLGKHFHVITALPNVFLAKLEPGGRIKPPSYSQPDFDQLEHVGVSKLEDFTWKQLLDAYTCVDCGRCSDHCPAYASGTPLSPRMLSIKTREAAYRDYPLRGAVVPPEQRPQLVGETITEEELWSCTTCGACEEACPVMIEYIDRVVDMRRFLVDDGRLPATLQKAMAALEKRGNPFGKMGRKRGDWVKEVQANLDDQEGEHVGSIEVLKKGGQCKELIFTDSCAAFDPRVQQTAIALGELMVQAGVEVGTLGKDEVDSGNEARRFGEEGLYLALKEQNVEALEQREFERIVTSDPHAMNALRHDYELEQPVVHHSQVLAELIAAGKLKLQSLPDDRTYTFHDPCYLGRHNHEYNAPRQVLEAIPGIKTAEMERTRNRSFCCGGGSLNLFHETECEKRMGEIRLDQAEGAGAQVVVTACPYCLVNLEDAVKTSGRESQMEIIDLVELVKRSVAGSKTEIDAVEAALENP